MMTISPVIRGSSAESGAFLGLFCFGFQFFFGFVGSGLSTPLGWSLGMALFAVGTGWRAPQKAIPTSVLIGTCYAAAANVPIYLIGRWLGDPTSASVAFTAIASILGIAYLWVAHPSAPNLAAAAAAPTKLSPSETARASSEVKDVFKKLHRLMDNEKAQNERLPEPYRSQVLRGADCDEIAEAVGEFGRDPEIRYR